MPIAIACAALSGCALTKQISPDTYQSTRSAESRKLHEIFESFFEAELVLFPTFATEIGDHRYDDQLEIAISEEHIAEQRRLFQRALRRAGEIKLADVDSRDRLYLEVFTRNLQLALDGLRFKQQLMPVRQLANLTVEFPLLGSGAGAHPFRTVTDYENFLKRIAGFETWVDTAIANMRQGIAIGVMQPRAVIERALPQLQAMIVTDAKTSLFYQPVVRMPGDFSAVDRNRLTRAYTEAIEQRIVPAYRRLLSFLEGEYLAKSRNTVALSDLPDGKAWYEYLVRTQTTTDLTPEEIFQLGMSEIARIKKEMERMREEKNFTGSLSDFSRYLNDHAPRGYQSRSGLFKVMRRSDAPWRPGSQNCLAMRPRRRLKSARSKNSERDRRPRSIGPLRPMVRVRESFTSTPRVSRPIRAPLPSLSISMKPCPGITFRFRCSRSATTYRVFNVSPTTPPSSKAGLSTLLGKVRARDRGFRASQYFSRLSSELFRAARLVIDVGLHRKGWSRAQAINFLMDTALNSESGATLEVDRYIAVPAQALSYKIGQLKIAAIRSKAEKALGAKFDIRAFHDELLRDGALPLDLLEQKMDRWIALNFR